MFAAGGLIFLVRSAGLNVNDIVVGMSVAGLVGLLLSVPLGHVADRIGPRTVCVTMLFLRAAGTTTFLVVHSLPLLLTAVVLIAIADRGGVTAAGAIIANIGGTDRVRVRALLQSVTNIGIASGATITGIVVAHGTHTIFTLMILGTAFVIGVGAVALLAVTPVPPVPRPPDARWWESLRDRRYVAVTATHGVLSLHFDVMTFAIPLWILQSGSAPAWMVSILMIINTVMVILLQVPASRAATTVTTSAALGRRAGAILLLSCTVIGLAGTVNAATATALLVGGVAIATIGELWQSASAYGLSFGLAPNHAHGQYQGVFALGRGAARAAAPALLGWLCMRWGLPGWITLGALLLGAGALLPYLVRSTGHTTHDGNAARASGTPNRIPTPRPTQRQAGT
jgi:MFS family permease